MATKIVRENIVIRAGTTFAFEWTWTTVAGVAVDLSGYTAAMYIVDSAGTSVYTATSAGGQIALGGAAGTVTVTITAANTGGFTVADGGAYSLVLTSAGSQVTELVSGHVSIVGVNGL